MTSCHVWFAVNTNKLLKKLNPNFFIILRELNWDITVTANHDIYLSKTRDQHDTKGEKSFLGGTQIWKLSPIVLNYFNDNLRTCLHEEHKLVRSYRWDLVSTYGLDFT